LTPTSAASSCCPPSPEANTSTSTQADQFYQQPCLYTSNALSTSTLTNGRWGGYIVDVDSTCTTATTNSNFIVYDWHPTDVTSLGDYDWHPTDVTSLGDVSMTWLTTADAAENAGTALDALANQFRAFTETPEQQAAREEATRARQAKLHVINRRAAELLWAHLSDAQRTAWQTTRSFRVRSQSGRLYELTDRRTHNVFLLSPDGSTRVLEYCVYANDPGGWLPLEDNLFAQLLALQFDEASFLAKANTWRLDKHERLFIGQGVDHPDQLLHVAA
jgi:hypothetical protein